MQTEVAMSDFSSGKIEQPVRKKMEVKAHNGSAGNSATMSATQVQKFVDAFTHCILAMMPCWSQDGGLR